jgi:hypothetical protein
MRFQRLCIKTICIVCAAMDAVVDLHSAVAGVRARMAALERFLLGCGPGGEECAEGLLLAVGTGQCDYALKKVYGEDGLKQTYLSVYADFAVLVVAGAMYRSQAVFNHHVDATHYLSFLKGASADAITLQGYMRGFSKMAYEAAFSLVAAPWEGEWGVVLGGVQKPSPYPLFGKGEADAWAPNCAEIAMDGAKITFRWAGREEEVVVWDMRDVQPAGFNVEVPGAELDEVRHQPIPLRFGVRARDYNHLSLDVARNGITHVTYALERRPRVGLRPLPPPLADAARERMSLRVNYWRVEEPWMDDMFKRWCKRVELCVHEKFVLLKLGREGQLFKQTADSDSCDMLLQPLDSTQMTYLHEDFGRCPIAFKLTGGVRRVVLLCYYIGPSHLKGHPAFNIPFVLCHVWEGIWSVQQITALPQRWRNAADKVPEWNTECCEIEMTNDRRMVLKGVGVTTDEWRINADPEPLTFGAWLGRRVNVACSVDVEDYNRIKLRVHTVSYFVTEGKDVSVPTVEYTLARKHVFMY